MAYEFRCADAGDSTCGATFTAQTEQELRDKLTEHLRHRHRVSTANDTILAHLLAVTKQT